MPIEFSPAHWDCIKADYHAWWEGRLQPLIPVHVVGRDPGRPRPDIKPAQQMAGVDFAIPPDAVVDLWDWQLSCAEYLGDAFPWVWPNFGPGVIAAFLVRGRSRRPTRSGSTLPARKSAPTWRWSRTSTIPGTAASTASWKPRGAAGRAWCRSP